MMAAGCAWCGGRAAWKAPPPELLEIISVYAPDLFIIALLGWLTIGFIGILNAFYINPIFSLKILQFIYFFTFLFILDAPCCYTNYQFLYIGFLQGLTPHPPTYRALRYRAVVNFYIKHSLVTAMIFIGWFLWGNELWLVQKL